MSMFKDYPDIVNVSQLSKMLDINKKAAYQLLNDKKIFYLKIGRVYRIPKISIIKFINES